MAASRLPALLLLFIVASGRPALAGFVLLEPEDFKPLFHDVKLGASSPTDQGPLNEPAFEWAKANVPFFESSDKDIEAAFAFRWRAFYTHIIPTNESTNPWVISECFSPTIPGRCDWGAPTGTINAAAGHHIREGRWIRDPQYMDSYIRFWYGVGNGKGMGGKSAYSDWITHAAWARAEVSGDASLFLQTDPLKLGTPAGNVTLLEQMVQYFESHEQNSRVDLINLQKGVPQSDKFPHCYYKSDGFDAMEGSISGNGCRPSNNAMFYGNALALSKIASAVGNTTLAQEWEGRAADIRKMYLQLLWNEELDFFAVYKDGSPARAGQHNGTNGLPFGYPNDVCGVPPGHAPPLVPSHCNASDNRDDMTGCWRYRTPGCPPSTSWHNEEYNTNHSWACNTTVGVRELLGLGPPWYFGVPPQTVEMDKYLKSWEQLFDEQGFQAEWGPTTAEQRHRCFNFTHSTHECNWAAPSWPYETSRVMTGLSNLLNDYPQQSTLDSSHYMQLLRQYARAHTKSHAANASSPYIGENIEPHDGYWVARQIMYGDQPISHGGFANYADATEDKDRSVDYNHSTFADLIIEGLVGLRAMIGSILNINPLASGLKYFALDNVFYHNHSISVAFDEDGSRHYKGCAKGLCVFVDGELRASSPDLRQLNVSLG